MSFPTLFPSQAAGLLGMDADELSSALRRRKVRVIHPGRESVHEARVPSRGLTVALTVAFQMIFGRLKFLICLEFFRGKTGLTQVYTCQIDMPGATHHIAVPACPPQPHQSVVQATL